jgi:translation initiation factor 1
MKVVARREKSSSNPVYSTESGRLCPQCHRPVTGCVCGKDRPTSVGDGIVRIRRETKGRNGKAVSVITGLPLPDSELKTLAKELKKRCGVGGSSGDGTIEIQGEQRDLLKAELEKRGYTVKIAGG